MLARLRHRYSLIALSALLSVHCSGPTSQGDGEDFLEVERFVEEPLGKADAVPQIELKLMLAQAQIELAREIFGLADDTAAPVDIFFFETPERTLFDEGLILRARLKHGEGEDSTVKHRPMTVDDVESADLEQEGFKCEIDRGPHSEVSSCSFTVIQQDGEIADVVDGTRDVEKLFSRAQEHFAAAYVPQGHFTWDELVPLGPIEVLKWRVRTKKVDSRLTMELWTLPDGMQMFEVSTKVSPDKADEIQAQMHRYLETKGLRTDAEQLTKTRIAMDAFSGASE
jgi:hypothetical protein